MYKEHENFVNSYASHLSHSKESRSRSNENVSSVSRREALKFKENNDQVVYGATGVMDKDLMSNGQSAQ